MSVKVVVLAALVLLAEGGAGSAQSDGSMANAPFAMMRTLQVLEEQVAHGNTTAQAAQPRLLAHIAERFRAADPSVWKDPRNARSAVLFLLSGGRPSVIRDILKTTSFPSDTDRLLKGSLAYAEGQDDAALALLKPIDARALPTVLGGHVALVQATLVAQKDSASAEKLLDLARLLAPGTLVEEAALRRQVFLLADRETIDKFVALSRQYVRRFRKSVYAENFKQRFTSAATRLALMGDVAQLAKLEPVMSELPVEEQRAFYLAIARTAIIQGKTAAARFAAEKAAPLAPDLSADAARSKLYLGAALIVTDDTAKGLAMLQGADSSHLSASDADLRDAALTVAQSVQVDVPSLDDEADDGTPAKPDKPTMLMEQARKAIEVSDQLLHGGHS